MLPSEYFDRNVKIGASNTRRRELGRRYEIGVGNIMWGNDFPHPEGTWPYTRAFLKERFCDIPIAETAADPRAQPGRLLRLRPRRPSSDRASAIGPTPGDLGQSDDEAIARWEPSKLAGRPWLTGREVGAALTDR